MNYTNLNKNERDLLRAGQYIEAIKAFRYRMDCGLKEAKDVCDEYRKQYGLLSDGLATDKRTCVREHTPFIRVNSITNQDAIVCATCGAMYVRA
jgi:hypothetical protein